MMRILSCSCLLLCSVLISCAKREPTHSGSIPEDTFVNLYAGVLIAQEEGNLAGLDSATIHIRIDSICRNVHVSREQFQSELDGYRKDLTVWRDLNDKVSRRLDTLQREEPAVKAKQ